jgi:hypothetical protein
MKAKTTHGPLALVLVLAALARRSPPVAAVMTTMTSQSRRPPRPPPRPRAAAAAVEPARPRWTSAGRLPDRGAHPDRPGRHGHLQRDQRRSVAVPAAAGMLVFIRLFADAPPSALARSRRNRGTGQPDRACVLRHLLRCLRDAAGDWGWRPRRRAEQAPGNRAPRESRPGRPSAVALEHPLLLDLSGFLIGAHPATDPPA